MAEVPKRYFERFFVLAGFIFVTLLLLGAFWIHNKSKLEAAEVSMTAKFKEFKIYKNDSYYLPAIKILGPKGDFINIRKFGGRYTVLNIWATWCGSCIKELPSLGRLNKMIPYEKGWQVIAISIDFKENLPKVAKFTKLYGVEDIANYNDYNMELQKNINVSKLPMTLIVNKSGRILYEIHGAAVWHDKAVIDFLDLIRKVY